MYSARCVEDPEESEVDDLWIAVGADEDVGFVEIEMENPRLMRSTDRFTDLEKEIDPSVLIKIVYARVFNDCLRT